MDIHNVFGLWVDPDKTQDVGERHANPLGNVGPAFFDPSIDQLSQAIEQEAAQQARQCAASVLAGAGGAKRGSF